MGARKPSKKLIIDDIDEYITMICNNCLEIKEVGEFYNKKAECKECFKKRMIYYTWKKRGIRHPDFIELYNFYSMQKECYFCGIGFDNSIKRKRRCLDHCDLSGSPRFIICSNCNINLLPKIDNLRKKVLLELHRYFLQ